MTWDQFIALMLGVAATAIIRLLDKYLPPPAEPSHLATAAGAEYANTEPMAGPPPIGPGHPVDPEWSGAEPPPGYTPPHRPE